MTIVQRPRTTANLTLYHGTRSAFSGPGGLLLPGSVVNKENHRLDRSDVVYVTPDLELAWAYAEASKGRGKPRVLEVFPQSALRVDDSTVCGEEQDAYTCTSATVLRVIKR